MPGRLDFEHELHDEAENPVKDMEFGLVMQYGGGDQPGERVPGEEGYETGTVVELGSSISGVVKATIESSDGPNKMDVDEPEEEEEEEDNTLIPGPIPIVDTASVQDGAFPSMASSSRGLASSSTKTSKKSNANKQQSSVASSMDGPAASASSLPSSSVHLLVPSSDPLHASPSQSSTNLPSAAVESPNPPPPPLPFSDSAVSSSTFQHSPAPVPAPLPPHPTASVPPVPVVAPLAVNTDSPDYLEDSDDLMLKLAILEIYNDKLDRRREAKNVMFQRGLMDHKKVRSCYPAFCLHIIAMGFACRD